MYQTHKAFTMIELVFVIAVIGILAGIAIPKFAASRNDAVIAKAKSTVAAVRMGLSTAQQKMTLKGDFTPITTLSVASGYDKSIFDGINGVATNPLLEYPPRSCKTSSANECWYTADRAKYTYKMPMGGSVDFNITNNKLTPLLPDDTNTRLLTD